MSTGHYITIYKDGRFIVGEFYWKDVEKWERGTRYYTDGKEEDYDESD